MGRKILFLDIDGVLNNRASMMMAGVSIFRVHPDCVARLRFLVEHLGVKIVLSSTWRKGGASNGRGDGFWRAKDAIVEASGWVAPFIGVTPDLSSQPTPGGLWSSKCRGEECNQWVRDNGQPGDVYVAVDDDADFETFVGTLVRIAHEPGLTDEDCEKIAAAFARKVGE